MPESFTPMPSSISAYLTFRTLGVVAQGDDVDFAYVACEHNPCVVTEADPVVITDTPSEQP